MTTGYGERCSAAGLFAAPLAVSVAEELDSWQIAVVAFGFIAAMLVVGWLLEYWGLRLHA